MPAFNLHPEPAPPSSGEQPEAGRPKTLWRRLRLWIGIPTVFTVAVIVGLNVMFPTYTTRENVETVAGYTVSVVSRIRSCVYWDVLRDVYGFYIYRGFTSVDIKLKERTLRFTIPEELRLFAVNIAEDQCFLIFRTEYDPGRGFCVYSASLENGKSTNQQERQVKPPVEFFPAQGGDFKLISITALPPLIAYRNLLSDGHAKEYTLPIEFLNSKTFLETDTAGLWGQIETDRMDRSWAIDEDAVNRFKQKFLAVRHRSQSR